MKACTCFLLFGAFAYTNPSPVTTPTKDKKGTNVTRKSVSELNIKEASKNIFGATNKTVIGGNKITQAHSAVETFTDFMQELVIILNTYNDDIFEDFTHIVNKELKKYPYRTQNEFKNLLSEESSLLMRKSVFAQRAVINQIVDIIKLLKIFDTNIRELLDYINSLYRNDAKIKFRKILANLKGYSAGYGDSRTKIDFIRLIRECVRANIFIHTNLNTDVKRKLKKHIDIFMKKIKEFPSSTTSTANLINFKPTISKSNTYTVTISENIATKDKTPKPSLKLNPTKTTAYIQEENKRIKIFREDSNEGRQEDTKTTLETSKRDESNNQQTNITHLSKKETATELMFFMMTEIPGIFYKSGSRSRLVERMFGEETPEIQTTGQSTTTPGSRLATKNDFHRSRALPVPGEEISEEIFDRDRSMWSYTRTSKFTTERPELKEYLKRMRYLQTEVERLKIINEHNRNSKPYKDVENNSVDEHDTNDDGPDLRRSAEIVHDDINHRHSNTLWILKKKDARSKSKKTIATAETSIKPNKQESKKLELTSSESLSTAKDNAINTNLAKTRLNTTQKVDNTAINVSGEVKQRRINETATKGIIQVTEDNINETTTPHSFRRLAEAFPLLFEEHSLKQGLYPANMWE